MSDEWYKMTPPNDQRPESARRRIVVPLGQPPAGAGARSVPRAATPVIRTARKGRIGKVLAILALLFVVVLLAVGVGAFLWWQHYQTTPPYSLALLVDAAQRNDMPAVDLIVDTDKIVDNLAAQVMEKAAGRYGGALSGEVNKTIRARVPALLPVIKQQVRSAVTERVRQLSAKADQKPFVVIALAIPYFVTVTTEGDKASAITSIHDQQVKLDLEHSGTVWKVVAVHDDALVQQLVDQVIKELPAIGPNIDSEIKKNLRQLPQIRIP
jgi:BMFP domain-containing protein YqiC